MSRVRLILVGGFLGAGKTTLLARAAALLVRQGKRVGLITNDQAADLVDTQVLRDAGFGVGEISGGCFCCRFENLVTSADRLIDDLRPDVLIGEPVGSCTDLVATVVRPLKRLYADRFQVAPFSVLADPERLRGVLGSPSPPPSSWKGEGEGAGFDEKVLYIFRKQLEEADLVVVNKADRLSSAERPALEAAVMAAYPGRTVLTISALTGEGVDRWLDLVTAHRPGGDRVMEVDYDAYAAGEAALSWLNATVRLEATEAADWAAFCRTLLETLRGEARLADAEIAHVKLRLATPGGMLLGNLTASAGTPMLRGTPALAGREAELTVNARVAMDPEGLRAAVGRALSAAGGGRIVASIQHLHHLSPGRPTPTHRMPE